MCGGRCLPWPLLAMSHGAYSRTLHLVLSGSGPGAQVTGRGCPLWASLPCCQPPIPMPTASLPSRSHCQPPSCAQLPLPLLCSLGLCSSKLSMWCPGWARPTTATSTRTQPALQTRWVEPLF